MNSYSARSVLSWEPVDENIITLRVQLTHTKATIIQAYAPTNVATDDVKDDFYNNLQTVIDSVPSHDLKIIMGDFNAQIGSENIGWETIIGRNATGTKTDNGMQLMNLCSGNELKIGGSMFQHKTRKHGHHPTS